MDSFAVFFNITRDARSQDFFLLDSPITVLTISISYVMLIKIFLFNYMEKKQAFNTRLLSLGLNVYLLSTAFYFTSKCIQIGWFWKFDWSCAPIDKSDSEEAMKVV